MFVNGNRSIPEIFKKAQESFDQVSVIKPYAGNPGVRWIVELFYKRGLDKKELHIPHYKASSYPLGYCYSNIPKCMDKIERALEFYDKGDLQRYDRMMANVLETIHKDEAFMIEKVLKQECDAFYGIDKKVFKEVFPDLFAIKLPEFLRK